MKNTLLSVTKTDGADSVKFNYILFYIQRAFVVQMFRKKL